LKKANKKIKKYYKNDKLKHLKMYLKVKIINKIEFSIKIQLGVLFGHVLTFKAFAKIILLLFNKEKVFCKLKNNTVEKTQQK